MVEVFRIIMERRERNPAKDTADATAAAIAGTALLLYALLRLII
jgi:hypothetical protein